MRFHFVEVQKAYGLPAAAEVTVYPISLLGVESNSIEHAQDIGDSADRGEARDAEDRAEVM